MSDAELAVEKQLAHEKALASAVGGSAAEGGSSHPVLAGLAWLAVGGPLAYGIWVTLQKSAILFH